MHKMARKEWAYLVFGAGLGVAWLFYAHSVDFGGLPEASDAVGYFNIANGFRSFGEAFTYAGNRTFGFPFVLYLIKRVIGLFTVPSPAELMTAQTTAFFVFHFLCSILFYRGLRDFSEKEGVRVHPIFGALLLAHPAMVANTAVLLTDTFATDLIMLAIAVWLGSASVPLKRLVLRGFAAGLFVAWAIATRPFFLVTGGAFVALALVVSFTDPRRFAAFLIPFFCAIAAVLAPAATNCRSIYGQTCLQNPNFATAAVAQVFPLSLTSYRIYWSARSPLGPGGMVSPDDPSMIEHWGKKCAVPEVTTARRWLECVFTDPLYLPLYLGKKAIGLFDAFVLHSYASDATTSWVRRYSRAFGTLSFIGFFAALAGIVVCLRKKRIWEALAITLPVLAALFQLPMHLEARYSFPAVPVCLFAAIWGFQQAKREGGRVFLAYVLGALLLGGVFLVQTSIWDREDVVLQQIEGARP